MRKLLLAIGVLIVVVFPCNARIQNSPIGASAECRDGTYSTSTGRGTCSHHGGVKRWLNRGNSDSSYSPSPRRTLPPPNVHPSQPRSGYRTPSYQRPSTTYYPPVYQQPPTRYYPRYTQPVPTPTPAPRPRPRTVKQDITLPSEINVRVVGVHDGDTITVLYFERYRFSVRLYGIDAPENSQPFSQASKKQLSTLVYGKDVKIYSKGKDRYGRLLGWVFRGPACINKEMVLTGHAWWYRQYAQNENGLRDAERLARQRKVGLWATKSPVAPWAWRKS